ncbi:MAG: hypothetical protein GY794_16185 [bacterium]|nr:hypothetical protein [bacterium]
MADIAWRVPTPIFNEENKFDADSRSISTVDAIERMINAGFMFYGFANETDIPDGENRYYVIRSGGLLPHFRSIDIAATEGPINANLFENAGSPLLTLGDFSPNPVEITTFNANRNSPNLPEAAIWSFGDNVPASPLGEQFLGNIFIPGIDKSGVTGGTRLKFVMKPHTDYVLEVQNDPAGNADVSVNLFFEWFEVPWIR